jgi:predicted GNAT family acetyltransferase
MRDNAEHQRFELDVDGAVVFADYRRGNDLVAITHVEAPRELRGKGHADRLMREVADAARAQGWRIRPPFAATRRLGCAATGTMPTCSPEPGAAEPLALSDCWRVTNPCPRRSPC